jgi:HSP20 family protein
MLSLRQMMDRLMEEAFVMPREGQAISFGGLPLNVYEEGDNYVVETHLPGLKPEDVDVSVEGNTLTIRGETKAETERKERNYLMREHRYGRFERSLRLPDTVDPNRAQANFENGVLRLSFPKTEQAKPRKIAIGSGGQKVPAEARQKGAGAQGTAQ